MKFEEFAKWLFYAMITALAGTGVSTLKDLNKSVGDLNTQVAVLIEKNNSTQTTIKDLDERIKWLEKGKR